MLSIPVLLFALSFACCARQKPEVFEIRESAKDGRLYVLVRDERKESPLLRLIRNLPPKRETRANLDSDLQVNAEQKERILPIETLVNKLMNKLKVIKENNENSDVAAEPRYPVDDENDKLDNLLSQSKNKNANPQPPLLRSLLKDSDQTGRPLYFNDYAII
ncbi:uncharacterized protein LOC128673707 isoform X2 [Plodia interpunctella]|uniref:uncharacterized protein LOC128673707 isoform X2 n=1 Tax=Plodia interpunctella TaxID=58824 RepID=UPI00236790D6|nr:uncharacterized protein LOC128673707 isoform X2 [Plodia interpunctella]